MGVSKEETRAAANQSEYDDSEDDFAYDMDKKKNEENNAHKKEMAKAMLDPLAEDPVDDDLKEEEMKQEILNQFDDLYNKDPELREALSKSKVSDLDVEQKYEIITAYMSEGGIKNLQFEVEDEEEDMEDLQMQEALENMSEEEKKHLNQ